MNKTISEKKAFLEEIIPLAADPSKKDEIQQKHYAFLLKDTNDGKLYKYRTFDSHGYALNSLINGTLHCSRPDTFNDPFDCRLGVTYVSLTDALMNYSQMDKTFTGVAECLLGRKPIEQCGEEEQAIIQNLLDKTVFSELAGQLKTDAAHASFDKQEKFIKEITKELLRHFTVSKIGRVPDGLMEHIDNLDVASTIALDHPPTILDFMKSMGLDVKDGDEISNVRDYIGSFYPAEPDKLQEFDDTFSKLENEMAKKLADTILVGCLAGDPKHRLMWSHYADSHKGFCIEYDARSLIERDIPILPVFYSHERPLVPWDAVNNLKKQPDLTATINMFWALLTKDEVWKYENEWRVLLSANKPADVEVPITAIYLGAHIRPENKAIILEIANNHKIPVKQMKTDRGAYELHAEDILSFEGE